MDEQLQPQSAGSPRRDRRLIVPAVFVAALVGGGVAGHVLGGPSVSAALQSDDTTTEASEETTTEAADETTTTEAPSATTDGSTESDSAAGSATDCGPAGPGGRGGPGGPGGRGFGHLADLSVAADALGVTEDELRESLQGGSSIAEVADAQDVEVETVIDALVAAAQAELDERVAAGELDEERAAAIEAELVDRITAKVNGEFPPGPARPGSEDEQDAATSS
jgi:hypothetical protein